MWNKDLFRTRLRDLQPQYLTKDQSNRSAQWPKNAESRNTLDLRLLSGKNTQKVNKKKFGIRKIGCLMS